MRQFHLLPDKESLVLFKDRFLRTGKRKIGVVESFRAIALSSWLNVFIVFIPLAWVAHFRHTQDGRESGDAQHVWSYGVTFAFCFLAIVPLERLFEYGGEQMSFYCGSDLGDLIIISLNNTVEATLAIILMTKCELKLLQSTIIGVVVLHLLLIPGTSFIAGGARILEQELHPHPTQLNLTLLAIGVLSLLLPTAFFASIQGVDSTGVVNDETRRSFLQMSRGLAIILLLVYICSRIFLHTPPASNPDVSHLPNAPEEMKVREQKLAKEEPEVSQWVCIIMLIITIGLMTATAEWLVDSIEFVRVESNIEQEWFGLILLPVVSFSAGGAVAVVFFVRYLLRHYCGMPSAPNTIAKARAIDLSIQFILFWMPLIVLLAWWTGRPFSLLFDTFEVALTIGTCFLVNYVTADAKTNWAEGFAMVSFYAMIVLVSWFYTGQPEIRELLACTSVTEAVASGGAE
ncbi:hypothetical protein ARMGADRAFT_946945 [Armillaria gallica]|uniref:Sodium/calcium exchanger membrane region domain-containing protein n=1 Tax=Armillaria gallica TaxID=47427 RepID=A0A2H3CJY6_ARMGA|nr:hypothetical protein ARMGADRAFT_946945 [Armillaria gallica]